MHLLRVMQHCSGIQNAAIATRSTLAQPLSSQIAPFAQPHAVSQSQLVVVQLRVVERLVSQPLQEPKGQEKGEEAGEKGELPVVRCSNPSSACCCRPRRRPKRKLRRRKRQRKRRLGSATIRTMKDPRLQCRAWNRRVCPIPLPLPLLLRPLQPISRSRRLRGPLILLRQPP